MSPADLAVSPRYSRMAAVAAASYVVLFMLSQFLPKALGQNANAPVVTPYSTDGIVVRYLAQVPRDVPAVGAFLQATSALALLMLAALAAASVRRRSPESAHADLIRAGGIASATLLLASASFQWVLARPSTEADLHTFRAVLDLVFVTGAAPNVATTGVLIGAVAVAAKKTQLLPAWLNWLGLTVAALSAVSMLSLLAEPLTIFIPLGRYIGMVWFLCLAVLLGLRRGDTA